MFFVNRIDRIFDWTPKGLDSRHFLEAAEKLGVEKAAIQAVASVEARSEGFRDDRPIILFERHVFYRQLADTNVDRDAVASEQPDICNPRWGGYGRFSQQWPKLQRACNVHESAALSSASWGLFQIMGYHAERLGYSSVRVFADEMERGEHAHLEAFVRFVQVDTSLHDALRAHEWAVFARLYNGPQYARNEYDKKMAAAYARFRSDPSINL